MEPATNSMSAITQKLMKREDERLATQFSKRAEKQGSIVAEETTDYFKAKFTNLQQQIEAKLDSLASSDVDSKYIDDLTLEVNLLQALLTESTHFLSQFSIKAAQNTINNLKNAVAEKKNQCVPKKKFGFKTRVTKDSTDSSQVKTTTSSNQQKTKHQFLLETNSFIISNINDSEIIKHEDDISLKDVTLSNLSKCKINLFGSPSAVRVHRLVDCIVFIGPVSSSIFIEDCTNCVFLAACQQMRIHKTTESKFFIHVTSRAIIEECNSVSFAPFTWNYESLDRDYEVSGLDRKINNWNLVEDFNWLVPGVQSPNWSILPENERTLF